MARGGRAPAFDRHVAVRDTRDVRVSLPGALVLYAAVAAIVGWWPSALAAPLVAWLLWHRHARARFAAYIFLSVLAARGLLAHTWPLAAFAVAAIVMLQLPAAHRVWPRLTWGRPLR